MSKYSLYTDDIKEIYHLNEGISLSKIGKLVAQRYPDQIHLKSDGKCPTALFDFIRKFIKGEMKDPYNELQRTKEVRDKDGNLLWTTDSRRTPIEHFSEIPEGHELVRRSANASTGQEWIITQPKKWSPEDDDTDYIGLLTEAFEGFTPNSPTDTSVFGERDGICVLADLHFGAYIDQMLVNPEFSITILCDMLERAATRMNSSHYRNVDVFLMGDLIESFTGLSHKNTWKGLDKGMFGVSAVKLFVELFKKHFLDKLVNLRSIKMVAGNHDRVTSDNKEDVDGGAAELIAWGLELIGYDVEFSTSVLNVKVDGISYILNHGHLPLTSRMTAKEMSWTYGEKGMFNFILEAHLHSRIQKMSANQRKGFKMISDDTVDTRRQVSPSLFTGNTFSENLGFSTTAGFLEVCSNGDLKMPKPIVVDYPF